MVTHGGSGVGQTSVLVELLREVVPLSLEEPEEILRLFVRVGGIRVGTGRRQAVYYEDLASCFRQLTEIPWRLSSRRL